MFSSLTFFSSGCFLFRKAHFKHLLELHNCHEILFNIFPPSSRDVFLLPIYIFFLMQTQLFFKNLKIFELC